LEFDIDLRFAHHYGILYAYSKYCAAITISFFVYPAYFYCYSRLTKEALLETAATRLFTGRMPFLSPSHHCQSSKRL